jgi:hypothetical protein
MPRREVAAEVAVLIAYFLVGAVSRVVAQFKTRLHRS